MISRGPQKIRTALWLVTVVSVWRTVKRKRALYYWDCSLRGMSWGWRNSWASSINCARRITTLTVWVQLSTLTVYERYFIVNVTTIRRHFQCVLKRSVFLLEFTNFTSRDNNSKCTIREYVYRYFLTCVVLSLIDSKMTVPYSVPGLVVRYVATSSVMFM
jgi:hypothetical protein